MDVYALWQSVSDGHIHVPIAQLLRALAATHGAIALLLSVRPRPFRRLYARWQFLRPQACRQPLKPCNVASASTKPALITHY